MARREQTPFFMTDAIPAYPSPTIPLHLVENLGKFGYTMPVRFYMFDHLGRQEVKENRMPKADEMIQEVRDVVLFGTRRMDAPSQRRILRTYGAQYRYLPDEAVDADDTAPDTAGMAE